jgi:hypothetical protein
LTQPSLQRSWTAHFCLRSCLENSKCNV